jgi:hypothetical protein
VAATSDSSAIRELESRLQRPDRGENGYREGSEARTRLDVLVRLREFAEDGKVARSKVGGGINTHVHTGKSFGYFESPCDAVWHAYLERVAVFGINDHYTLAGHSEFGRAAKCLGIRPTFSMEAVAMWGEAEAAGLTVNDPANPGRTYLTAKGVTRAFSQGSRGAEDLERMNEALYLRNQEITKKLSALIAKKLKTKDAVSWEAVLALTPHDQPTERHITLAAARFLEAAYEDKAARSKALSKLVGEEAPPEVIDTASTFQDYLRSKLVKAGCPAYAAEGKDAFVPVERMVSLALDLGAIPTYPVLGNPVTPWEEDIDRLYDRLEVMGIHAVEVIPNRNTRERLLDIVSKAAARGFPIFTGTEHNTKTPMPLVDKFFFDETFRPHFERGARVLLGHQALRRMGEDGYVLEDGALPPGDREANLMRLEDASRKH